MTAPNTLRHLRTHRNGTPVDPPHYQRIRHALATTYRHQPPPPQYPGEWWAIWWQCQRGRHRWQLALAVTAGLAVGWTVGRRLR